MRETGPEQVAASEHPVLRHDVDPASVVRSWVGGVDGGVGADAVVVERRGGWADAPASGASLLCVGARSALEPLMASVARVLPTAWRVVVEQDAASALPAGWRIGQPRAWHWMLTREAPAAVGRPGREHRVVEVDPDEADTVLALVSPASSARRERDDVECRVGVRDARAGDALVAVGALARRHDGTGHLTGIAVLPRCRGRGLGAATTAALTERALADGSGVATLGVYADNEPAIAIYERLGYARAHTFVSGLVGGPPAG